MKVTTKDGIEVEIINEFPCKECHYVHPKGTLDYELTHDRKFKLVIGIVAVIFISLLIISIIIN